MVSKETRRRRKTGHPFGLPDVAVVFGQEVADLHCEGLAEIVGEAKCPLCRLPLIARMFPWGPSFLCFCDLRRAARAEAKRLNEAAATVA